MRPYNNLLIGTVQVDSENKIVLSYPQLFNNNTWVFEYNKERKSLAIDGKEENILCTYNVRKLWELFYWYRHADDFLRNISIPENWVIYSNNSNPYIRCSRNENKDVRIYPKNTFELCQCIDKVKDTENRLCLSNEKENTLIFWFCWKD